MKELLFVGVKGVSKWSLSTQSVVLHLQILFTLFVACIAMTILLLHCLWIMEIMGIGSIGIDFLLLLRH